MIVIFVDLSADELRNTQEFQLVSESKQSIQFMLHTSILYQINRIIKIT